MNYQNAIKDICDDEITVSAKIEYIAEASEFVRKKLSAMECPVKTITSFEIALDEIFSNSVKFSGSPDISVRISYTDGQFEMVISDSGTEYDIRNADIPDITLPAEEREVGGLGLFIVGKLMDSVEYQRLNGRNIVVMRKNNSASERKKPL